MNVSLAPVLLQECRWLATSMTPPTLPASQALVPRPGECRWSHSCHVTANSAWDGAPLHVHMKVAATRAGQNKPEILTIMLIPDSQNCTHYS